MIKEEGNNNMVCSNCGKEIDITQKFCINCGEATNLTEDKLATITVTREKKALGFAIPFELYIDNSKIGNLPNNSSLNKTIILGEHVVTIKSPESSVTQNILLNEEKKDVEIKVIPKMGFIAAKPKITQVLFK